MRERLGLVGPVAPPYGGMSVLLETLHKSLTDYYDIELINTNKCISHTFGSERIKKVFQFFLYFLELRNFFLCDRILIVSSSGNYFYFKTLPAILLSKFLNIPIIVDFVGGDILNKIGNKKTKIVKWLKKADLVFVPTDIFKIQFSKVGLESIVVPHIVDIERFKVTSIKQEKIPVFLAAKNLHEYSNVLNIIKAFEIIKKDLPESKLLIAGDGPQKEYLEDYVSVNRINDVKFLGNISYDQMPEIFSQATVFLHATRIESFGLVLVEAMAAGLPIISSNVGGIPALIKNDFNGILVDSEDFKSMAKWSIELFSNHEKYIELKTNGLKEALKYSIAYLSPKLFEIISSGLNSADTKRKYI